LVAELSDAIERLGGDNVMAFVAETIGGATAGVLTPVPGYFRGIRELCDRHGILLILDEVMCGMGRTGTMYACEQEAVVPDLLTIAKGLGGGYQPIGAVLAQGKLVDAFRQGSGLFQHGHTYLGHAVACAATLAVQRVIQCDGLLAQVQSRSLALQVLLKQAFDGHPHVGDIRGRGLFWGTELVADRASKQWFDPARKLHIQIKRAAMAEGLMVYPWAARWTAAAATTCCSRRPSLRLRPSWRRSCTSCTAPSTRSSLREWFSCAMRISVAGYYLFVFADVTNRFV
jgi:adenosylmethionine-8-amino-7-oxononanoate aminotransferase